MNIMNTADVSVTRRRAHLLTTITTAAIAAMLSGCSADTLRQEQAQAHLDNAADAAVQGKMMKAREEIEQAIDEDPHDAGLYVDTTKLSETDPDALMQDTIDGVYASVGDYTDVEANERAAAAKFPGNYHPLVSLLNTEDYLGQTADIPQTANDVINVINANVTKGNTDPDELTYLAMAYWDAGDQQKAVETYQRIFSIDPGEWPAYNSFAYQVAESNAKPYLTQALTAANTALAQARKQNALDFQIAMIRDTLGWVEYRLGDDKNAEIDINDALEVIPGEAESHYHLGMIYLAEGDKASAKSEIQKALSISPDYAPAKAEMPDLKDAPDLPPLPAADPTDPAVSTNDTP